MKLALIGATGVVGSRVLPEALERGHAVTAICRHPEKISPHPLMTPCSANAKVVQEVAKAVARHDAVICCYNVYHDRRVGNEYAEILEGVRSIIQGVKRAGVKRMLVVGGAGSLFVSPGVQLIDHPEFPAYFFKIAPREHLEWLSSIIGIPVDAFLRPEHEFTSSPPGLIAAWRLALHLFEHDNTYDWTFLSPPWFLRPGPRTGRYRIGGEDLPMDGDIPAGISCDDLAVAIVDEMENPKHTRQHWTVASAQ